MVYNNISKSFSPRITTVVIPATNKINGKIDKIKELIQKSISYLEDITKCRYYPVPTIIVDEIPPEDREKYGDSVSEINLLGVYFHQNSIPSNKFKSKLAGYPKDFIETLFSGGCVAIAYDHCFTYAEQESNKRNLKDENKDELFWDIFNAVLIHEHAHAITFEGIYSKKSQFNAPIGEYTKTYAYKIVCEALAEWLSINYYRESKTLKDILYEHSKNNNASLFSWPYGGALHIEKVKTKFINIFKVFRKNYEDAIPLFLKDADEFIIKLFCAYKTGKKIFKECFEKLKNQKNIVIEAVNFVHNAEFIERLIENGADVNEKDSYGNTALKNAADKRNIRLFLTLIYNGADYTLGKINPVEIFKKNTKKMNCILFDNLKYENLNNEEKNLIIDKMNNFIDRYHKNIDMICGGFKILNLSLAHFLENRQLPKMDLGTNVFNRDSLCYVELNGKKVNLYSLIYLFPYHYRSLIDDGPLGYNIKLIGYPPNDYINKCYPNENLVKINYGLVDFVKNNINTKELNEDIIIMKLINYIIRIKIEYYKSLDLNLDSVSNSPYCVSLIISSLKNNEKIAYSVVKNTIAKNARKYAKIYGIEIDNLQKGIEIFNEFKWLKIFDEYFDISWEYNYNQIDDDIKALLIKIWNDEALKEEI